MQSANRRMEARVGKTAGVISKSYADIGLVHRTTKSPEYTVYCAFYDDLLGNPAYIEGTVERDILPGCTLTHRLGAIITPYRILSCIE